MEHRLADRKTEFGQDALPHFLFHMEILPLSAEPLPTLRQYLPRSVVLGPGPVRLQHTRDPVQTTAPRHEHETARTPCLCFRQVRKNGEAGSARRRWPSAAVRWLYSMRASSSEQIADTSDRASNDHPLEVASTHRAP